MSNIKITDLNPLTTPEGADILAIVDDVAGTATTKKVTVTNLMGASPVQSVAGRTGAVTIANTDVSGLGTAATSASTDFSPAFFSTVAETTTARPLSDSDNGKVIVCTSSSDVTITIPNTLTAGFGCTVVQSGTGQVTVAAGSGSTLSSYVGTSTKGRYAVLQIVPVGTNTYIVDGEGFFPPGAFESNIYALDLDGANEYANPNHTFESLIRSDFSMSLWVKLANETGNQWLIGGDNAHFTDRFNFYHDSNKIVAYLKANGVQGDFLYGSTSTTYTDWFHCVLTYTQNGTSVDNALYINGSQADTGTTTNMSLADYGTVRATRNLGIGALISSSTSGYLEGKIDEVAFFNSALSLSQVVNIYKGETDGGSGGTNGKPGNLTTFNPQHWWRMGDNDSATGGTTPTTVTDKGGATTTYDLIFPNGATSHDLSTGPDSIYVAP